MRWLEPEVRHRRRPPLPVQDSHPTRGFLDTAAPGLGGNRDDFVSPGGEKGSQLGHEPFRPTANIRPAERMSDGDLHRRIANKTIRPPRPQALVSFAAPVGKSTRMSV